MKYYQILLWNQFSQAEEGDDIFGCSVHGLSFLYKWFNPGEFSIAVWGDKLTGIVFSGTFRFVLDSLATLRFTPSVCIAFFRNGTGVDAFLKNYSLALAHIPIIGGVAAFQPGSSSGDLVPDGEDLTFFAVANGNLKIDSMNIYDETGISVEVMRKTAREFELLRILPDGKWQNALSFYNNQQVSRGIDPGNFEMVTFSDKHDRNMHFRSEGQSLISGADLPDDNILYLKVTSPEKAEKKLAGFISRENSLIFGCAGIRSLLNKPMYPGYNSLMVFMFGEVFTLYGQPMFGNLMITRLTII